MRALVSSSLWVVACAVASDPRSTVATPHATSTASTPTDDDSLRGAVRTATGATVSEGWAAAHTPDGNDVGGVAIGPDGTFVLPRIEGPFAVTVTAPGGTAVVVPSEAFADSDAPLQIQLDPIDGGTTLEGHVQLAGGPPPANFTVTAARVGDAHGEWFVTPVHVDGSYAMTVPAGSYFVGCSSEQVVTTATRISGAAGERIEVPVAVSLRIPAPAAVVEWLAAQAWPLRTVDPSEPDDDLAPLVAAFGDARLIGVGEATHGTAEYFRFKHRLFRRLVERHGVTVLAMEANVIDAEAVDAYVRGGAGSVDDALRHLFLVWQTAEIRELLLWMRSYNADPRHRRKLRFHGYDVQDAVGPLARMRAYLGHAAPDAVSLLEPLSALVPPPGQRVAAPLTADSALQTREATARLVALFDTRAKQLRARSSARAYAQHRHYAHIIAQTQSRMAAADPGEQFAARDRGMAENIAWLRDQAGPHDRIMVWAHNGHISLDSTGLLGRNMGSLLRERFGADYVAVGFLLGEGQYSAAADVEHPREMVQVSVDAPVPGQLAETFARAGVPMLAVDLRAAPAGPVREWFAAPHVVHSCGWLASEYERRGGVAAFARQFDLAIYLDHTSGAQRLDLRRATPR